RIAGDSLSAPTYILIELDNQPTPSTPFGPRRGVSAQDACDPAVAKFHTDIEAYAAEENSTFIVTPWYGTQFPAGDPAFFVPPVPTMMTDLAFFPLGGGPGAPSGAVSLYGLRYDDHWNFLQNWDWTPGTLQSIPTSPTFYAFRLVDCGDDVQPYIHGGQLNFL